MLAAARVGRGPAAVTARARAGAGTRRYTLIFMPGETSSVCVCDCVRSNVKVLKTHSHSKLATRAPRGWSRCSKVGRPAPPGVLLRLKWGTFYFGVKSTEVPLGADGHLMC